MESKKLPGAENEQRMEFMLTLRQRGISDKAVLRAMDEVPREHFVEAVQAEIAYADNALPIACGQTISQPYVVAYMTEQLQVKPNHRVLEVGTGSGYQAAVLSRLAREVVTLERYRTLANAARTRLKTLGYDNVEVLLGDGLGGHASRLRKWRGVAGGRPGGGAAPRALRPHHGDGRGRKHPAGADRATGRR